MLTANLSNKSKLLTKIGDPPDKKQQPGYGGYVWSSGNQTPTRASRTPKHSVGVTDPTGEELTFAEAWAKARKAGEKEFIWNGEKKTTESDMTPEQQLKVYGITDKQRLQSNIIRDRIDNNLQDFEYWHANQGNRHDPLYPIKKMKRIIIDNEKETDFLNINGEVVPSRYSHKDLLSLYLGKPQKHNTVSVSKYVPSDSKDKNKEYFSINSNEFKDYILSHVDETFFKQGIESGDIEYARDKKGNIIPHRYLISDIGTGLGQFTIGFGNDDNGKYISYWDKWDLNPYKGQYSTVNISNIGDISMGVGKPFEIYDRIYYRDNPDSNEYKVTLYKEYNDKIKKLQNKYIRQYYSDKELSELDTNKKNFDTLALQRELSNRGYKLPKSTKQDGTFDGILGGETKEALLDWQSKNKPKLQHGGYIPNTQRTWKIMQEGGEPPKNVPKYMWDMIPDKDKQAYYDNPQAVEQWYNQMLASKSGYTPVDKTQDKTADYWSKGEQYKRNLKGLANIGLHTIKMPLEAGATAAAIQMAGVPIVAGTTAGLLGKAALSTVGAMGADYLYNQAGGKSLGDALGVENPYANFALNMVSPGSILGMGNVGMNKPRFGKTGQLTGDFIKGNKVLSKQVDNVVPQTSKQPWQMQEMPGLHLKSTMEDGAISKIVDKTGKINTEQALGIIAKESGGADKVALIRQGLGDNIPAKMDYNEFRKVVQDQLIPLERQFSTQASKYGLSRIGYAPKYKRAVQYADDYESFANSWIKDLEQGTGNYSSGNYTYQQRMDKVKELKLNIEDFKQGQNYKPLENQTLILGNKDKFGRGSSAHGNPEETLGHIHFLRDAETPDVLTVTQIQSDAFQGPHRIMPKTFDKEAQLRSLTGMENIAKQQLELKRTAKQIGNDTWELLTGEKVSRSVWEDLGSGQAKLNAMKKAEIENFTQKQLLDKNHQERYLQELVDYAGKRGDVNKVRVPTSETAAKVQGYSKTQPDSKNRGILDEITVLENNRYSELPDEIVDGNVIRYTHTERTAKIESLRSRLNTDLFYSSEHQTILKKYSEQPKTIKKLFGIEPKIVTDSKGNTWYEFDIPKKFKEGKGEIKAFEVLPPAAIIGAGALQGKDNNTNRKWTIVE